LAFDFYKYSATGNDFIVFDNREGDANSLTKGDRIAFCSRRTGIGADGVLFLERSEKCDFKMVYFNSDGGEEGMCGNGGRAITHFAYKVLQIPFGKNDAYSIETQNGVYQASIKGNIVKLQMTEISGIGEKNIENLFEAKKSLFLKVGVSHSIFQVQDCDEVPLESISPAIRKETDSNINFFQVVSEGNIKMRTFEKGVEGETLSCGTGATATALACQKLFGWTDKVQIETKGGLLEILFDEDHSEVFLCGETRLIFKGSFETQ
jgi:diaminopimelate epimerase